MNKKAYQSLSRKYRKTGGGFLTEEEVAAYVAARMPATKAAIQRVFEEIAPQLAVSVKNFLDLGSGPGTGLMAALEVFPELEKGVCIEANSHMIEAGKGLVKAQWIERDLGRCELEQGDLALFGYSYGELDPSVRPAVLERAFEKASVVVVVEPGTPRGYANVLEARDRFIALGAHLIAPCPHEKPCPMKKGDWCHFGVRLPRTKEHKSLKEGALGHEDEKYSYVAFSKIPVEKRKGRILKRPQKKPGHVVLHICAEEGIIERIVSKKEGSNYRSARKLGWGHSTSLHLPNPHCS